MYVTVLLVCAAWFAAGWWFHAWSVARRKVPK